MSKQGRWIASTPAGSVLMETKSTTREKCIAKLLKDAAHMPYKTWENFEKRGYTVDFWEPKPC